MYFINTKMIKYKKYARLMKPFFIYTRCLLPVFDPIQAAIIVELKISMPELAPPIKMAIPTTS